MDGKKQSLSRQDGTLTVAKVANQPTNHEELMKIYIFW